MVESVVEVVFESLLGNVSKLFKGVKRDLESLNNELKVLKSFLNDQDAKLEEEELSEAAKTWVKQVREVAELIEDIVDEHMLKKSKRQRGFISKVGSLIDALNDRHKLASNIENVKALLLEIKERGERYDLKDGGSKRRTTLVERYRPVREDSVVGSDASRNELIQRLMEGAPRRSVLSLLGAGGIGKTTLARKVYENEVVRQHFDCRVWITVSQSHKMEELLKIMLKQIFIAEKHNVGEIDMMQMEELARTLQQYLESKRYLFVFDDVWREEFWQVMKNVLPDNGSGNRIIITTRSAEIVAFCKESLFDYVHKIEPLSEPMSWDLFRRTVFQDDLEFHCPRELEQLSFQFLRMCEGLPLAIVAIAGLLSTKEKSVLEWKKQLDSLRFQLESNPHLAIVSKILSLSLRDLPPQLKSCFYYFTIFPEDFLIPNTKLFKLWIAEGFVQERRGKTLEEVAEEYLNELIHGNLVQASEGFYGLEKFCRVHTLMHEIARQKADEDRFCSIHDGKNSNFRGKSHRLSISNSIEENVLDTIADSQVRSVFLFNISDHLNKSFLVILFQKYKLLTMLDFENLPLEDLPNELGNLLLLKYLSLKNTKVKKLPRSLSKLQELQTLDLRNTLVIELPMEINKLKKLRHLLASGYDSKISLDSAQGVMIKEGIACLGNLQTLMTVEAHLSGIGLMEELKKLRQLRRLGISRLIREFGHALCACIESMSNLECLSLHSMDSNKILDLQTISFPPPFLQRLVLKGRLQIWPNWFSRLQNLSMLCLSLSKLTDDPLKCLSRLPKLVSLWLYRAYDGEQLHFEEGDFPKLKLLVLRELLGLKVVEIERGALPFLEELRIGPSPLMNEVPSGIQYLTNLKVLANYEMSSEFVLSMQPDGGSDYSKVEHVPSVLFWYRVQGRRYMLYKLGEPDLLDHLQGLATSLNDVAQCDLRLSFSYGSDEEHSASTSVVQKNESDRLSFSIERSIAQHPDLDRLSLSSDWSSLQRNDVDRLSFSSDRSSLRRKDADRLSFSREQSTVQWIDVNRFSFIERPIVQWNDINRSSFSSDRFSFFSDDVED